MLAILIPGGICEQFPFYSLSYWSCVWVVVMWLPGSSCSPHAPPDDTSDKFSFRVKDGLVIELCFHIFLNDGLGSFVGWLIFIFSPSPLDSARAVMLAILIPRGICEQFPFFSPSSWSCVKVVVVWLPGSSWSPRAPLDDINNGFLSV